LEEFSLVHNELFTSLTLASAGLRLHHRHLGEQVNHLELVSGDFGVLMETESLRFGVERQGLDVLKVVVLFTSGDSLVETR